MKILLTNDDGLESPALIPTIQMLENIGDVEIVVPRFQQSWTSKSNTRRAEKIEKSIHKVNGYSIISLNALPADCANYGIFRDQSHLPDLVVSGANIGHNVGLNAFFSSGTIGAALEGLFAHIPSVAISVPYTTNAELVSKPFAKAIEGMDHFLKVFYQNKPDNWGLVVLNLPYDQSTKEIYATHVGKYPYGRLFVDEEDGNVRPATYYDLQYPPIDQVEDGSDVWARYHNYGSLVVMDFNGHFIRKEEVQNWLEQNNLGIIGEKK